MPRAASRRDRDRLLRVEAVGPNRSVADLPMSPLQGLNVAIRTFFLFAVTSSQTRRASQPYRRLAQLSIQGMVIERVRARRAAHRSAMSPMRCSHRRLVRGPAGDGRLA